MLVLRDDTLACLELLEEDRLALSSLITVEARVVVGVSVSSSVVSSSVVSVSDVFEEEPSSLLLQEMMVKLRNKIRIMYKTFFIFSSIPKVKYYCLCIRRTQYIPRFGGVIQVSGDFTWRVSDWWTI